MKLISIYITLMLLLISLNSLADETQPYAPPLPMIQNVGGGLPYIKLYYFNNNNTFPPVSGTTNWTEDVQYYLQTTPDGTDRSYQVGVDVPITPNISVGIKANPKKIKDTYQSPEYRKQASQIKSSYSSNQYIIVPFFD